MRELRGGGDVEALEEIEADLPAWRARAEHEGWLGEADSLDLTINYLRQERDQARRLVRTDPVDIGLPRLGGA
jgi:hypothetical protein